MSGMLNGRRPEVVRNRSASGRFAQNPAVSTPPIQFGPFRLDIANARLTRDGQELELPPKSFELLAHLAQRPGELVLKDQLLDAVWGRRFVSEGAVKTVVSELRAALGDDPKAPRWIETVQRRGYRFIGTVAPAGAAAPAVAPSAIAPAVPAVGNLPPGLSAPIGRDVELGRLEALWASSRLVTLTGTAGVGKTRLALAAAAARRHRHADGVWLVELAPLPAGSTDAATLRSTIARTLLPGSAGLGTDAALVQALQGMDLLLVVDNAEHLLETLAPLLAHLHAQLPRLHLLLTSREPLQVPGERLLRVEPLTLPADEPAEGVAAAPALQLLVDRIAARLPGFVPDAAQQRALARLCRLLDGLPLALELAAARVPVLGVHGLVEHLAGDPDRPARLRLLTQGTRTAAPHQRTLRAALDWSHELLTPTEQRVFRRLGIFRGGFTLAAVEAVAADPGDDAWALLDTLNALVDKSMVVAAPADAVTPRFGLLESLREHALEHLTAAGEVERIARRHLAWARAHWTEARRVALTEPVMSWTARLQPELDNLRAALRWGQDQPADAGPLDGDLLALLPATARFWQGMGLATEGADWCRRLMERAEAHPDPLTRAGVDLAVASLCRFAPLGSPEQHLARAQRAAAAFAAAGDEASAYYAHYLAWALALEISELVDRSEALARMQALARPDWSPLMLRFLRSALAQEARLQGRAQDYLQASRDDMAAIRGAGAQAEAWLASYTLMLAEHDQGHVARALAFGQSVLDEIRAAGRLRGHAQLLCMHTAMRAADGDIAGTRAALVEALPMLGGMAASELLYLALAWLAAHEGRDEDAALVLGWFESPQRGGGQYGPRTFTRRSAEALAARLDQRLGAGRHAELRATALDLGAAEAVRRGQRVAGPERRRVPRTAPAPRTDGNPTAT